MLHFGRPARPARGVPPGGNQDEDEVDEDEDQHSSGQSERIGCMSMTGDWKLRKKMMNGRSARGVLGGRKVAKVAFAAAATGRQHAA